MLGIEVVDVVSVEAHCEFMLFLKRFIAEE